MQHALLKCTGENGKKIMLLGQGSFYFDLVTLYFMVHILVHKIDFLDFAHDDILIKLQKALPSKVLEVDDL